MSGFESLFGTTFLVFLLITILFMGGCAFMTGQALADTWRPQWQLFPYMLLLGAADRFIDFALFGGVLLSPPGYLLDTAVLTIIALAAYRATRARKMAAQYPWLYRRSGVFTWQDRGPAEAAERLSEAPRR